MTDQSTLTEFDPDAEPPEIPPLVVCNVSEQYDTYGGRGRGRSMANTNPPERGWLGNPHRVSDHGRAECIQMFKSDFIERARTDSAFCEALLALPGMRVACHCRYSYEDQPACHLDVVRETLLNGRIYSIAAEVHDLTLPEEALR